MKSLQSLTLLSLLFLTVYCTLPPEETDLSSGREEVLAAITEFYDYYAASDLRWTDYYMDTYTSIGLDASITTKYADSLKSEWADIYTRYDMVIREIGEFNVHHSGDQAYIYNTYDEFFISKESGDTSVAQGTYITHWTRQPDDSWKISVETFHLQNACE